MMTPHIAPDYLARKNNAARLAWLISWHKQGGNDSVRAHDLMDLRDEATLKRWRDLQVTIFQLARELNIATWRRLRFKKNSNKRLPMMLIRQAG